MNPAKKLVAAGTVLACVSIGAFAANPPAGKKPAASAKGQAGAGAASQPAATAPSKQGRIGNILFRAPTGWEVTEKEKERIAVLNPPGENPKLCSVVLVSGERPPDGDFLKWFKDKWTKLCQGLTAVQEHDVTAQQGRGGVDVLYQQALLEDEQKHLTGVLLYAAKVGDGVEWAVFQTAGKDRFNQYNKRVSGMLGGLRFERKEVRPAEGSGAGAGAADPTKRGAKEPQVPQPPPDFSADGVRQKVGN
jgi:hypothetical protein